MKNVLSFATLILLAASMVVASAAYAQSPAPTEPQTEASSPTEDESTTTDGESTSDDELAADDADTDDQPMSDEEQPQPEEDNVPPSLRNPRATMQTFLDAADDNLLRATSTMDFSMVEPLTQIEKRELARKLKRSIDRIKYVDYEEIPAKPEGEPFKFAESESPVPIVISRDEAGAWRFSAETVAGIDSLWEQVEHLPLLTVPWWQSYHIGQNQLWRVGWLFLAIFLSWLLGRVIRFTLSQIASRLEKGHRKFFAIILRALGRGFVPLMLAIGLKIGLELLVLNPVVESIADVVTDILIAIAIAYVLWRMVDAVDFWLQRLGDRTGSKMYVMLAPMTRTSLRITIVVLLLVQIATMLSDKPVTSVIAGLGVGGLAVGLAAQDSIKNFFGSVMIFSDRPFEVGDRIVVDGHDGPVESVGFRSTRIRTLEGNLVTIPNGELANKAILNIGKRPHIRRIMNIGVTYDTPPEKLERAVEIIKEILNDHEGMEPELPPRVFFQEFADASLTIFVIYWYHPPAWWDYCEFSQRVNFEILKRFNAEEIEFAFPTQTLYLAGDPNRPLGIDVNQV